MAGIATKGCSSKVLLIDKEGQILSYQKLLNKSESPAHGISRIFRLGEQDDYMLMATLGVITLARVTPGIVVLLNPSLDLFSEAEKSALLAIAKVDDGGRLLVCGQKLVVPMMLKFN